MDVFGNILLFSATEDALWQPSNWVIIGLDNSPSPIWHQAII